MQQVEKILIQINEPTIHNVGWYNPVTAELKFHVNGTWQEKQDNYSLQSSEYDYAEDLKDGCISGDATILDPGEDKYAYGVLIDWRNGNKDPNLQRIGNPELHRLLPVQSQYKGVIWDHDNKEIYTYLNPDDWTKSNGAFTEEQIDILLQGLDPFYDEETGEGVTYFKFSVRVNTPKFYACGKVLEKDSFGHTVKAKVLFSTKKINSNYVEVPEMVTSFRNDRKTDNLGAMCNLGVIDWSDSSMIGGSGNYYQILKPLTNVNRHNMQDLAQTYNSHVFCYEAFKWILYWAVVIEFATFDTKKPFKGKWTSDDGRSGEEELDENGYHIGGLGPGMTSIESYGNYSTCTYNYSTGESYQEAEKRYDIENYNINKGIADNMYSYFSTDINLKCIERNIGCTITFGNHSGENLISNVSTGMTSGALIHQNRYRGFEFPFGDIGLNLDGFLGWYDETYHRDLYFIYPIGVEAPSDTNLENYPDNIKPAYVLHLKRNADEYYDYENGEGYDEMPPSRVVFSNGDLFPQSWDYFGTYDNPGFVQNRFYPLENALNTTLILWSDAYGYYPFCVGLGDFDAYGGVSDAGDYLGFRCYNYRDKDGEWA